MKYKNYVYLIILLLIAAINFNMFIKPLSLVCGGTQGLSIIINKITKLDYSIIILLINILMMILSILFLNKKITTSLIISTFVYPLFVKLTSIMTYNFNIFVLNIITVGVISGITNGLIYKLGFTSSGISLLGPLINKYTNLKIGTINLFINLIIMLLNLIFFGINNVLYSILVVIINSLVINLILYRKI